MPAPLSDATTPDSGSAWVSVDACTLPTADRPVRVAEFDELFASSVRYVQRPAPDAAQARLVLAGDATLPARVQRLADAETSCCSFFSFSVTRLDAGFEDSPGQTVVALDIEVPPAHADVLHALVDRAAAQVGA